MNAIPIRPATRADLTRIYEVRNGVTENPLLDSDQVTEEEVLWYMDEAIFLVSEDEAGIQGFTCAHLLTGYVWALFVVDAAQGRGHGGALLDAAMARLREAGHRQAFLTTGVGSKAEGSIVRRAGRRWASISSGNASIGSGYDVIAASPADRTAPPRAERLQSPRVR